MLPIRPNAARQSQGPSGYQNSAPKKGLRWRAPQGRPLFSRPSLQRKDGFEGVPTGFSRRQLLQAGLLSLLPLSAFGLRPAPAQAHPWEDIPIERLTPFSEADLRRSQAAVAKARPELLPFENTLLDRHQHFLLKANDWVRQAQELKAQGKDPRQVLDRAAQKAQRGDPEAQAVLDAMRQYFH